MVGVYAGILQMAAVLWLSPIVSAIIIYTDYKDGKLADDLDQHSIQGKILDPLRDRAHLAVMLAHAYLIADSSEIIAPIMVAISAEAGIALSCLIQCLVVRGQAGGVHTIGKGRAMVHWTAMLILFIQYYWIRLEIFESYDLIIAVSIASCAAFAFYSIRALAAIYMRGIKHINRLSCHFVPYRHN
jgi:phosphatidylglycerophosphate synthase